MQPSPPQLERGYAEFFSALSRAFLRTQIYPDGHPTVDHAVDHVVLRLEPLLAERAQVAFAVTPTQLSVGSAATDAHFSLLRDLAGRLFRRNIGAVRISRGIGRPEVATFLATLCRDPGSPGPASSPHVEIEPLSFEGLSLDHGPARDPGGRGDEALWAGLAGVMLGESHVAAPSPADLGDAFQRAAPNRTRDAAALGALALAAQSGGDAPAEVGRFLARLDPKALDRLLRPPTVGSRPAAALGTLVQVAEGPVALELLLAASRMDHRSLSPALVQLLTKMASHSAKGTQASRFLADEQLHEALKELIGEWEGPAVSEAAVDYLETLDHLPAPLDPDLDPTEAYRSDPLRLVTMHLDMGEVGPPVERAARTLVARGRVLPLVDLLEQLAPDEPLAGMFRPLVATPDALAALLAAVPMDLGTVSRLAPEIGIPAIAPLLDALAGAEERSVRRRLLELLARFGNAVTPPVLARLPGAPWFVQRNFLRLLQLVPDPPAEAVASRFALDPDQRVRVEGLRLLLRIPAARERGIVQGLADSDRACQRVAVMAAAESCPPAAAAPLIRRVADRSLEPTLRHVAVRALAPLINEPSVLDLILGLAARRLPLLGFRIAPKTKTSLAALEGLAQHWRWHPRTTRLLARAETHRDPAIRAAAAGPSIWAQLGLSDPAA